VNGEFNWWLLIVGLVIGGGLVWLVLADSSRRESEIADDERAAEATWIASTLAQAGDDVSPETAERILRLHRAYLASAPPDEIETPHEQVDADERIETPPAPGWDEIDDAPVRWDAAAFPPSAPPRAPTARRGPETTE